MTILIGVILIILIFLFYSIIRVRYLGSKQPAQAGSEKSPETIRLYQHVHHLSVVIGSRSIYEYSKIKETEEYIVKTLEDLDLEFSKQEFSFMNKIFCNIIVSISGSGQTDDSFIIGAHYDTVSGTPGADDNGSGVAVLLELCRNFNNCKPKKNLKLIFFVLEEPPAFRTNYMGSFVYAKQARLDNERIIGMISLEMVGFYSEKKGAQSFPFPFMNLLFSNVPNFIAIVGNIKSRGLVKRIKNSIKKGSPIAVESLSTFSFLPGINWSDHASFWKMGYTAVMITDTSFYRNPNYHRGSDTIETLDFIKMEELLKGLIQVVVDIVGPC